MIAEEAAGGDISPYCKSKTKDFDKAEDNFARRSKGPSLRKTHTMTKSPSFTNKIISSRNQVKQLKTDQEQVSNDNGYMMSKSTHRKVKDVNM